MNKYEEFFKDLYNKSPKINQQHLWIMCNFIFHENLVSAFESYMRNYKSSNKSGNEYLEISSYRNYVDVNWFTSQEVYDKPDEELTENVINNEWNLSEIKQMDINEFRTIDESDDGMLVYQDEFGRYFYSYVSKNEKSYSITITFQEEDYFEIDSDAYDTYVEFMDALNKHLDKIPEDSYMEPKWNFDEKKYKKEKTEDGKELGLEHKFIPQKQELKFESILRKLFK